jgi:hypothetical protein
MNWIQQLLNAIGAPTTYKVPGSTVRQSDDSYVTTNSLTYVKVKELTLADDILGMCVNFTMTSSGGAYHASVAVYKNGSIIGDPRMDVNGFYTKFSQNFGNVVAGDKIQLYACTNNALDTTEITNFEICWDPVPANQFNLDDGVHFDGTWGVSGTAFPIGSPQLPSNNYTDALSIMYSRNQRVIYIDSYTQTAMTAGLPPYAGISFIGKGPSISQLTTGNHIINGLNLKNLTCLDLTSTINPGASGCRLSGLAANFLDNVDCEFAGFSDCIVDRARDCAFSGSNRPSPESIATWQHPSFIDTSVLNMHACYGRLTAYNAQGAVMVKNMDDARMVLYLHGSGLLLDIDASCTLGTIYLEGDIQYTSGAGGVTINDDTIYYHISNP